MPTILTINGFVFHFYSSDRKEPIHVHIEKGGGSAKIWLDPEIKWAFCYGFKSKEQKLILKITDENSKFLKQKWHEHFAKK